MFLRATLLFISSYFITFMAIADELPSQLKEQICANTRVEKVPKSDVTWGCYDPLPGHATEIERQAFIQEISPAALDAERKYGTPAPALVAMALVESGAGFTRMPICSNNLYGWKWTSEAATGNRPQFTLDCQPEWDTNNTYIKFSSRTESVDFVAKKLSTMNTYKDDTDKFKQDINEGVERNEAIKKWINGIASPYNYDPPGYVSSIIRTINDPITPTDTINQERTLYRLNPQSSLSGSSSPVVKNLTPTEAEKLKQLIAAIKSRFEAGGRYVVGSETKDNPHPYCKLLDSDTLANDLVKPYAHLANHANAKLLECDYPLSDTKNDKRRGWTIILAATAENIAARIFHACNSVAQDRLNECTKLILSTDWKYPYGSNNFIFPVSGFIKEGPEVCEDGTGKDGLIGFRHGVTIYYAKKSKPVETLLFCYSDPMLIDWQRLVGLQNPTFKVKNIGRIAALSRDEVPNKNFPIKKEELGLDPDSWQVYVRDNEIHAIETGVDYMMTLKAAKIMDTKPPIGTEN